MAKAKDVEKKGAYEAVILRVFNGSHRKGAKDVDFSRAQVLEAAAQLGLSPKNVGDLLYTYRYRKQLPPSIRDKAPKGHVWVIRGTGAAKYRFAAVLEDYAFVRPRAGLAEVRIPDSTPGIIVKYALDDEQALLAKVRYNRLIDIFMGVAAYSLQSHLRTQVPDIGQVETDEVYVGIDKQGAHYVFPVQAKGGSDRHSIVQVEQDFAMCKSKFPASICRAVAAQFMGDDKIALFAFDLNKRGEAVILQERHYLLVPPDEISDADLTRYKRLALNS